MKQLQKGFTLIELMIVVAIIGILAAVAIPAYQDYVVKAKLSKVQSTLDPIKMALAMYYQENGSFPTVAATAGTGGTAPGTASAVGDLWNTIGLNATPAIPGEVDSLTVNGGSVLNGAAIGTQVQLTMVLKGIKTSTIDTKNIIVLGSNPTGTSLQWACDTTSTVTETIARKYFNCP